MTDILGIIRSDLPDGEFMDKMHGLISRLDKSDPDYDTKLGIAIECMRLHWKQPKLEDILLESGTSIREYYSTPREPDKIG